MLPTWSRKHRHFSGVTFGNVSSEGKLKAKRSRENDSTEDIRAQAITTPRTYPVVENARRIERLEESNVPEGYSNFVSSTVCRAAGNLSKNSSTEVIDVNILDERSISVVEHVCSNNTFYAVCLAFCHLLTKLKLIYVLIYFNLILLLQLKLFIILLYICMCK